MAGSILEVSPNNSTSKSPVRDGVPVREGEGKMTKPRRKHRAMFQDQKNRWWLDYYTPEGRRRRKLCGSHEAAKAALSEVETAKRHGTYTDENSAPFFEAYSEKYLEEVSTHKNSCDREKRLMKNLVAYFGKTRLSKIKRSKVREYRNARLKTVKPATVNREIALLRHLFNVAKDDDLVGTNPARGGPGLTAFKEKPRLRFLEMPEVGTLLGAIDAHIAKNCGSGKRKWQYLRTAVVVALHTGMRKTENLSLRWNQIDWEKRNILLEDTKNDEPRRVPIDTILLHALAEHRQRIEHPELVFPSYDLDGKVVPLKDVKVSFGIALSDAGISNFRFHDLRHTFASHYVMSGGNLYTLAKILGHKDIKMTQRYAQLSPDYIDRERERMDTIWTPAPVAGQTHAEPIQPKYLQ